MLTTNHKCLRCGLNMDDITGLQPLCVQCRKQPRAVTKWHKLVFPNTAPTCTFCKHEPAVAAEHGSQGLTGAFAGDDCIRSYRIALHVS